MNDSVADIFRELLMVVALYGMRVLGALLLLMAGWIVAGWAARTRMP